MNTVPRHKIIWKRNCEHDFEVSHFLALMDVHGLRTLDMLNSALCDIYTSAHRASAARHGRDTSSHTHKATGCWGGAEVAATTLSLIRIVSVWVGRQAGKDETEPWRIRFDWLCMLGVGSVLCSTTELYSLTGHSILLYNIWEVILGDVHICIRLLCKTLLTFLKDGISLLWQKKSVV